MASQGKVQGAEGMVPCTILGEIPIDGKSYAIINLDVGSYVKGVYSRYLVVPPHLLERNITDKAEEVNG